MMPISRSCAQHIGKRFISSQSRITSIGALTRSFSSLRVAPKKQFSFRTIQTRPVSLKSEPKQFSTIDIAVRLNGLAQKNSSQKSSSIEQHELVALIINELLQDNMKKFNRLHLAPFLVCSKLAVTANLIKLCAGKTELLEKFERPLFSNICETTKSLTESAFAACAADIIDFLYFLSQISPELSLKYIAFFQLRLSKTALSIKHAAELAQVSASLYLSSCHSKDKETIPTVFQHIENRIKNFNIDHILRDELFLRKNIQSVLLLRDAFERVNISSTLFTKFFEKLIQTLREKNLYTRCEDLISVNIV